MTGERRTAGRARLASVARDGEREHHLADEHRRYAEIREAAPEERVARKHQGESAEERGRQDAPEPHHRHRHETADDRESRRDSHERHGNQHGAGGGSRGCRRRGGQQPRNPHRP